MKDLSDNSGNTALMMLYRNRVEVVRSLLEAGVEKDLAEKDGNTALMMAADQGHADVVRVLLEAGANKDLADHRGHTALMMASARQEQNPTVIALLS